MFFSRCCGKNKNYDAHENNSASHGANQTTIDLSTNKIVCRVKTPRSDDRKRQRTEAMLFHTIKSFSMLGEQEKIKRACNRVCNRAGINSKSRHNGQPICGFEALIPIKMLWAPTMEEINQGIRYPKGVVVQITDPKMTRSAVDVPTTTAYSLCCQCASLTSFSIRSYGVNGLTCADCNEQFAIELKTPQCVPCGLRIKLNQPIHRFVVWNDLPEIGTYQFGHYYVCHHCYELLSAQFLSSHIYTTSELKKCKYFKENKMEPIMLARMGREVGPHGFKEDLLGEFVIPQKERKTKTKPPAPKKRRAQKSTRGFASEASAAQKTSIVLE